MTLFIEEYEFLIMNRAGCLIGQKTDEGVKEVSMVMSIELFLIRQIGCHTI